MPSGGKRPGSGRPKSSDNALIQKMRQKLSSNSDALIDKAVTSALSGDTQLLKFCLDKLLPSLKPMDPPLPTSDINLNAPLVEQSRQALNATLAGSWSLTEGLQVQAGIASLGRMIELEQLEARITQLEQERNHG